MSDRRFPVLWQVSRREEVILKERGCPRSVPWEFVAPHEKQAKRNHDQTLQRLSERGGLSPMELVCVIEGRKFDTSLKDIDAALMLVEFLRDWEPKQEPTMSSKIEKSIIEACARAAHEVNRAYSRALGDKSHAHWEEAPEWQKESARIGAKLHLESGGNMSPADSHGAWLMVKATEGWVYGPVKDPEKKEHPCCLPYDQLPPEQRMKDHLFRAVVHATHEALNSKKYDVIDAAFRESKGQPGG